MTNQIAEAKGDFLTNPQQLTANIVRQYLDPQGKASNEELAYFIATCKERNLNPFTKEVYFIKYGTSPAQIVVSKDAFIKRAEQNPQFDGFEAGIVVETQDGKIERIEGTIKPKSAALLGGWCKVYRKDRSHPITADADLTAYNTGKSMWAKAPALMIRKVAVVSAFREAFSENVGGLYTSEEMEQAAPVDVTPRESREEVAERRLKEAKAKQEELAENGKLRETAYPEDETAQEELEY